MKTRRCCQVAGNAGWALPGAILVLLPKCPVCLAAYIATSTGFGLSFSAATHLRSFLLVSGATSLLYLAVKSLRHFFSERRLSG